MVTNDDYIIRIFSYNAICEGTVYFQKAQDAKDAADLLGDELKLLF